MMVARERQTETDRERQAGSEMMVAIERQTGSEMILATERKAVR